MAAPWHEPLRMLCDDAVGVAGSDAPAVDTVLFYVARWCQKETGEAEPDVVALDQDDLADIAARVVRNLIDDGARVDRLVAGDAGAWTELRRQLYASACAHADAAAGEYADEALQKIAVVLLTGTPPSRAAEQLAEAVEGPRNEYVFTSPVLVLGSHRGHQPDRRRQATPSARARGAAGARSAEASLPRRRHARARARGVAQAPRRRPRASARAALGHGLDAGAARPRSRRR